MRFVACRGSRLPSAPGRRSIAAMSVSAGERRRRLLYLVSEDWYFLSHRLPMATAAQRGDYEVHVATHVGHGGETVRDLGFHLHALPWQRGSADPRHAARLIAAIRALYRRLEPDIVHHVAVEACLFGSLAAAGLPVARVNAITGLGSLFTGTAPRTRLLRLGLLPLLRRLLSQPNSVVLVQNADDGAVITGLGVPRSRLRLIAGSGVDVRHYLPLPEPDGEIAAAFVGRLLDDKGVRTLVRAHELLARRGRPLRLLLAGTPDVANRSSVTEAELEAWRGRPGLVLLGHVTDVRTVWAAAHIAVLPSRREGLPKSLLEAAACARPIVATDVPGCRAIARPGVNALLVPVDDADALAHALQRLAEDRELRLRLGRAGRELVEQDFAAERIGAQTVALYDELLRCRASSLPSAAA